MALLSPAEAMAGLTPLYGTPHYVPSHDALSELILTVLSQRHGRHQ